MSARARILTTVTAAVALLAGGLVWWISGPLRDALAEDLTAELEREARLVSELVGDRAFSDSLADRLGRVAGQRVTLIGPDGRVIGDSGLPAGRLPSVGNQRGRPEVDAALHGRVGTASRASEAVARSLLYAAVPHDGGVVRLATPTSRLTDTVRAFRRTVLAAAVGLVLLAALFRGRLEAFVVAPFRSVRHSLAAVADGDFSLRIRPTGDDESARLARTSDRLASRLEEMAEGLGERSELETIFQHMEEGVAVVAPGGRVTRANRAFLDLVGREDAVGERFGTLFRDPTLRELVERGLQEDATESAEVELGERYVLFSAHPHGDGIVVTSRDLTRIRRLEGVRRDFVANVSHELKTPLTSVLGFAEALADSDLHRNKVREFSRRILENGTRMRRMIDELLDLSRVESGAWEPQPDEVSLRDAARAAWREVRRSREGVRLEMDVAEELDVLADRGALRSVFRNLLDNAVRYSPEAGTVTVSASEAGGAVRVEVTDRGPGIPTAHHDRLFERFYRVDEGRARNGGGTGLGLAIVKHLVEAHGGEVGVESRVGEGTTVWFSLPTPSD